MGRVFDAARRECGHLLVARGKELPITRHAATPRAMRSSRLGLFGGVIRAAKAAGAALSA